MADIIDSISMSIPSDNNNNVRHGQDLVSEIVKPSNKYNHLQNASQYNSQQVYQNLPKTESELIVFSNELNAMNFSEFVMVRSRLTKIIDDMRKQNISSRVPVFNRITLIMSDIYNHKMKENQMGL